MTKLLTSIGAHERVTLIALLVVAAMAWGFAELAGSVLDGGSHALDEKILLAMRNPADTSDPIGPRWFEEMVRDVTALGSVGVLSLLTLGVVAFLALRRQTRAALFVALSVGSAFLLSNLLKAIFDRPRPDLVVHGTEVYTASFPSGHAMMSAATFLTLAALLARFQERRRSRAFLLGAGALLTLAVGASRVYLGVHWPTDVLAGWTAGAASALLCWALAHTLQERHKIEASGPSPDAAADP